MTADSMGMQDTRPSRQPQIVLLIICSAVAVMILDFSTVTKLPSIALERFHTSRHASMNTTSPAALEEQRFILLDTDKNSLPMMLNALITLSDTITPAKIARMTRVLCFDQYSCDFVTKAGFETAAGGIATAVLEGFNVGIISRTGNWLDDYCLAREQALLALIAQGGTVMRTDSDICFYANPFEVQAQLNVDILVTAQPLQPDYEGGMWSYNWQCNASLAPLSLTLNNGVIVINGSKPAIRQLYGQAYGLGVKLLSLSHNGWAQRGFNALLHFKGLCLKHWSLPIEDSNSSTATNSTNMTALNAPSASMPHAKGCPHTSDEQYDNLLGTLADGSTLATLKVSSPCHPCSVQPNSILAHANCLGKTIDAKVQWLRSIGCWRLPPNWSDPEQLTGNATRFLEHLLESAHDRNGTSALPRPVTDRSNTSANATQQQ